MSCTIQSLCIPMGKAIIIAYIIHKRNGIVPISGPTHCISSYIYIYKHILGGIQPLCILNMPHFPLHIQCTAKGKHLVYLRHNQSHFAYIMRKKNQCAYLNAETNPIAYLIHDENIFVPISGTTHFIFMYHAQSIIAHTQYGNKSQYKRTAQHNYYCAYLRDNTFHFAYIYIL